MGDIYQNHSIRCLKNLWRCVRAYNQAGNLMLLPPYFLIAFASPAIINRIRTERDVAARVIGHCVKALVVKTFVSGIDSSTDSNVQISAWHLACLSSILGIEGHDVRSCLKWPGTIDLASLASLALGDVGSLPDNALPSDALDVAQQTLTILSQALPAEETGELQLDQSTAPLNISEGKFDRIIVSRIHNLLQMCISGASPLTDEVRKSCLRMCLKCLWYCAKAYHQLGASKTLPTFFFFLAAPGITRHIRTEQDPVSHVIARCFVALVIGKLAVGIRSRTDSTVQISDMEIERLAAILGAESQDVKIWLRLPGTVALANMASLAFSEVDTSLSGSELSDMGDMIHHTLGTLSQSLSAESNANVRPDQTNALIALSHGQYERIVASRLYDLFGACTRRIPRLTEETRTSCLRMCLKSLWSYGRTYHQLSASERLPSYIPLTLGGPEMIRRIHSEHDRASRMIGRCFEALIVNNLAAHVKSRTDPTLIASDIALKSLSNIFSTHSEDVVLWLGCPGAVELANIVSLIFSEIHFFSDTAQSDVLNMAGQTFTILTRTLPAELNAGLWPDKTKTLVNFTDGQFDSP